MFGYVIQYSREGGDKDFSNLWLSPKEIKQLKRLKRFGCSEKKCAEEYEALTLRPYCFAAYTRIIGYDAANMPIYSKDYIKITDEGMAYLKYLKDKKFERNIPVKISFISLFLSAVSTAAVVVRLLFDYFCKK